MQMFAKKKRKKCTFRLKNLHISEKSSNFAGKIEFIMQELKHLVRNNRLFLSCFALTLIAMLVALFVMPKADLHLVLNGYHTPFLDRFFFHYTHFCNWPMYVLMALPLLCRRPVWSFVFGASEGLSAIVAHIVKACWSMPRPKVFFESLMDEHPALYDAWQQTIVEGVNLHSWHSFPSGHTTAFFAFFAVLAFVYAEDRWPCKQLVGFVCFVLALLGGYSRIYLSQHFTLDVCVGMVIGVLTTVLVMFVFLRKNFNFSASRFGNIKKKQ